MRLPKGEGQKNLRFRSFFPHSTIGRIVVGETFLDNKCQLWMKRFNGKDIFRILIETKTEDIIFTEEQYPSNKRIAKQTKSAT